MEVHSKIKHAATPKKDMKALYVTDMKRQSMLLNERAMHKIIYHMLTFIYAYKTAWKDTEKTITMGTYFGGLRWVEPVAVSTEVRRLSTL